MTKKFLHVGCGSLDKNGATPEFAKALWDETRLDIDEDVNPDVVASITDMSPVASSTYDAVYSSHNIEHLFAHEVPPALREMSRVLKDDGYLVITCPDLQSVCEQVANNKLMDPLYQSGMGPIAALDILYGHRASIASGNHHMAHKVGFTAKVLHSTIANCGFKSAIVAQHKASYSLWGLAYKGLDIEAERLKVELGKHTSVLND